MPILLAARRFVDTNPDAGSVTHQQDKSAKCLFASNVVVQHTNVYSSEAGEYAMHYCRSRSVSNVGILFVMPLAARRIDHVRDMFFVPILLLLLVLVLREAALVNVETRQR